MAGQAIQADHRWALARRLLHDTSVDPVDRFAGLLLLLYAQPAGRTVTLTTNRIVQRIADHQVQLLLGRSPIDLPPRLAELAVTLIVDRRPGRAALVQATDHAWLFPGSRPGTHLSSHQLNARLKTLGIDARAARNTTLLDLAAQLPAAVLSSLLGLGITTPTAWTHHAGHRTGYAAELAQRQPSSHQPRTVPFGRCTTCENSPRHAGDRYAAR